MYVRRTRRENSYTHDRTSLFAAGMIVTSLRKSVLARLSLAEDHVPDLERLRSIYRAWCRSVPFDNVRKMIALRTRSTTLPGTDPHDFFDAWLAHGTGATCWPGSIALHALLVSDGFDVRRATGSMRNTGVENHATLIVVVEDTEWLVDSSMLLNEPVPLRGEMVHRPETFGVEVEPVEHTHVIWYQVPPHINGYPCRLLRRDVSGDVFLERYRESRERSPFNSHLYARRNSVDGTVVIRGVTKFVMRGGAVEQSQLDRDGILEALVADIQLSGAVIEEWVREGGLEDTMKPYAGPPPVPLVEVPPSRRK